MRQRVVITGTGVISALSNGARGLHEALCDGRSGLGRISLFETAFTGGEVRDFDAAAHLGEGNLRPLDRIAQLSACAAHLTLVDSGWTKAMRAEWDVGLVLGTVFSSVHTIGTFDRVGITRGPRFVKPLDFANTVINSPTWQTAIWHNLRGMNSTLATGVSSGLQAIGYASDLVGSGRTPALLAGGAEELCFELHFGFERAGWLGDRPVPFDRNRNGFALGEGAAFVMVESADVAAARGAQVLCDIRGYGTAFDPSRGKDPACVQEAMIGAIRAALSHAGLRAEDIDGISASANGSPQGDRCEAGAIAACFGDRALPVAAIKAMLGETQGASGAIQVVALIEAMRQGVLPGILGLESVEEGMALSVCKTHRKVEMYTGMVLSFGFDGNMCALIVSRS